MASGMTYGRFDQYLDGSGGRDYLERLRDQASEAQQRAERNHAAQ